MRVFENNTMKVKIDENGCGVVKMKQFGDTYGFKIREDGRISAYSCLGLTRAMQARSEFRF